MPTTLPFPQPDALTRSDRAWYAGPRMRGRRRQRAIVVLMVTACSAASRGGDDAERYERGVGVARDYTRALRIYEARCNGGTGEPVACRKFALGALARRGEPEHPPTDPGALLAYACSHGDWLACIPPGAILDEGAARSACAGGQGAACFALTWAHGTTDSGTVDFEDHQNRERACEAHVLEACEELIAAAGNRPLLPVATDFTTKACRDGDADACRAIGTPIAPAELCRAHDLRACEKVDPAVVAAGDLDQQCAHRIAAACEAIAFHARDADPPDPQVAVKMQRACDAGVNEACLENVPAALAIGCGQYRPVRERPTARTTVVLEGRDATGAHWRAPTGKAFLVTDRLVPAHDRNVLTAARAIDPTLATYSYYPPDVAPGALPAALAPVFPIVLDAALWESWRTVQGGLPLVLVDAAGKKRASLATDNGVQPITFRRCVNNLLAEP